jgi:hypothetical protein
VAAVLVALVLLLNNPFQDQVRKDNPVRTALFEIPDPGVVDRIEVAGPDGNQAVLAKTGSTWTVESMRGFPADTAAVSSMLKALAGIQAGNVVSRNPDNRAGLGVDASGVSVRVSSGGSPLADFVIGNPAQGDFTSSYLRPADADEVYQVRGVNRNLFHRSQGYGDRTLTAFEPEQVASLTLAAADTGWTVVREDSLWTITSPDGTSGTAIEGMVMTVIRGLSRLNADGFAMDLPDSVNTRLQTPELTYTARLLNGSEITLAIGAVNDRNQRYVARPDRDAVYLLGEWRLNTVRKRAKDLLEPGS